MRKNRKKVLRIMGIAFSVDGKTPPEVEFQIAAEELSVSGWYYCESNYERSRNQMR